MVKLAIIFVALWGLVGGQSTHFKESSLNQNIHLDSVDSDSIHILDSIVNIKGSNAIGDTVSILNKSNLITSKMIIKDIIY
jgi:hypothetical protein